MPKLLVVIALMAVALSVHPQTYPNKPIRLVIPYPPGGGNDTIIRPTLPFMSQLLGQQIVIDNRGGAATTIGTSVAAKAAPDGYTYLVCGNGTHAISPHMYSNLPYDVLRDFDPVTLIAMAPTVLFAHNDFPFSTVAALVAAAKAKPGVYSHAAGVGSPPHFSAEIFMTMTGTKFLQVPYKGGGDANADLVAGRVDMKFGSAPEAIPLVKAGRVKALLVAADTRWPDMPDVPNSKESGFPNYKTGTWYGLCAPAKTPMDFINALHRAVNSAISTSELRDKLRAVGAATSGMGPKEFGAFIRSEHETFGRIIKSLNLKSD